MIDISNRHMNITTMNNKDSLIKVNINDKS
jgi:hypothetical protein